MVAGAPKEEGPGPEGFLLVAGNNAVLPQVDGLSSLTSVGGSLQFMGNEGQTTPLSNVDGLSSLVSVGGRLWIDHMGALTQIDGLSSLTTVGSDVWIIQNGNLCQSSVDAVIAACTIGGSITTYENDDGC